MMTISSITHQRNKLNGPVSLISLIITMFMLMKVVSVQAFAGVFFTHQQQQCLPSSHHHYLIATKSSKEDHSPRGLHSPAASSRQRRKMVLAQHSSSESATTTTDEAGRQRRRRPRQRQGGTTIAAAGNHHLRNGPLRTLRQAMALMNSLLQLALSTGDMFGSYSPSSGKSALDDLALIRRGGAEERRWARGRRGRDRPRDSMGGGQGRSEGEEEDGEEEGEEEEDDKIPVSNRDLNSWDTWSWRGPAAAGRRRNNRGIGPPSSTPTSTSRRGRQKKGVTFSTRYSCSVLVANGSRIEEYMSLPFDQYSLLDQSFISRVQGNVFRFMVPANELVGLQTIPIVEVKVDVDRERRVLAIQSISSRLVSRASDGTILGTHDVGLLSNNSLSFSTKIFWEGDGLIGGGGGGQAGAAGGGGGLGPGANLARLRKRIFQGGRGRRPGGSDPVDLVTGFEMGPVGGAGDDNIRIQSNPSTPTAAVNDVAPVAAAAAGAGGGGGGGKSAVVPQKQKRKLSCTAKVDVGVVVPPPFSLLPGIVLRRGASIVLSTLVASLVNRFLDLLIEDFYKWDQGTGRGEGSLLGYEPERYVDRVIETEADSLVKDEGEESDDEEEEPPAPEYFI